MIAKNRMIPAFDRDYHEEIRALGGANFLPHCSNHAGLCSWAFLSQSQIVVSLPVKTVYFETFIAPQV